MVVPAEAAWLALHVLLLLLAATPRLVSTTALMTSPSVGSSWTGHDDNFTDFFSSEEQQQQQWQWQRQQQHRQQQQQQQQQQHQQQQQQADMPAAKSNYPEQGMESGEAGADSMLADGASRHEPFQIEDIQVGCRELRAKRYISDGFCTSTKPIKEVVCAGNCLPIRDLPWYAEFVKVWARSKLREWQCEEDIVRRKTVSLLCRNGDYRTYRIKVVKSCKCKRLVSKHNRTAASSSSSSSSGEGKKKKNKKKKRKKDRRRRGRKNRRRGGEKKNRKEERGAEEEEQQQEEVEVDVSQDQRRKEEEENSNAQRKERRRNRKRPGQKGQERNSEPAEDRRPPAQDSSPGADSDGHKAMADPSR